MLRVHGPKCVCGVPRSPSQALVWHGDGSSIPVKTFSALNDSRTKFFIELRRNGLFHSLRSEFAFPESVTQKKMQGPCPADTRPVPSTGRALFTVVCTQVRSPFFSPQVVAGSCPSCRVLPATAHSSFNHLFPRPSFLMYSSCYLRDSPHRSTAGAVYCIFLFLPPAHTTETPNQGVQSTFRGGDVQKAGESERFQTRMSLGNDLVCSEDLTSFSDFRAVLLMIHTLEGGQQAGNTSRTPQDSRTQFIVQESRVGVITLTAFFR